MRPNNLKPNLYLVIFLSLFFSALICSKPSEAKTGDKMIQVPKGTWTPFLKENEKQKTIEVSSFFVDKYPVTNQEFLEFVKAHPKWRRDKVLGLFADENYLKHWQSPLSIGPKSLKKGPVVHIPWFAAKAFCESKSKTLPTNNQWEYMAQKEGEASAEAKQKLQKRILDWYSKPTKHPIPEIGSTSKSPLGIHDLFGLVWEWTLDFNTALVTGESREDSSLNRGLFCGSGSLSSEDKENYPAFMRYALRSSLKGRSSVGNLGFRCVKTTGGK